MSVDSVSVWDEEAALQSCWLDCEASPTSAYRYKHIYKDISKQVQTYLQRQMQIGAYIVLERSVRLNPDPKIWSRNVLKAKMMFVRGNKKFAENNKKNWGESGWKEEIQMIICKRPAPQ